MFSRRKIRFFLMLIISGGILAYWGFSGEEYQPVTSDRETINDIDGFLVQSETVQFDDTGKLKSRMLSDRIDHYPGQDRSKITLPTIHVYSDSGSETIATAERGEVGPDNQEILLIDNVNITEQVSGGYRLDTDFLRVEPDNDYAETHSPVTLLQKNSQLKSVGMKIYMDQDRILLLQDVRGHHERQ